MLVAVVWNGVPVPGEKAMGFKAQNGGVGREKASSPKLGGKKLIEIKARKIKATVNS